MRHALIIAVVGLWWVAVSSRQAAAQACHQLPMLHLESSMTDQVAHAHHPGMQHHRNGLMISIGATVEAATANRATGAINFVGVTPMIHVHHRRFQLMASVPAYQYEVSGGTRRGLGDLGVATWFAAVVTPRMSAGFGMPISFPTGNAERDLGMGHVMIMPSAYAEVHGPIGGLVGAVTYGRAIGDTDHHHGSGPAPVVQPMSEEEISGAARGLRAIGGGVVALADARVTVPVGAAAADPIRTTVGAGVELTRGRVTVGARVEHSWNSPIGSRGVLEVRVGL